MERKQNMPTVLRIGAFRFFFYSNEGGEPPHIHIQRDRMLAKFWLQPIRVGQFYAILAERAQTLRNIS